MEFNQNYLFGVGIILLVIILILFMNKKKEKFASDETKYNETCFFESQCTSPYACKLGKNGVGKCKRDVNQECRYSKKCKKDTCAAKTCVTNKCTNKKCVLASLGDKCREDRWCTSQKCRKRKCVTPEDAKIFDKNKNNKNNKKDDKDDDDKDDD